MNIYAGYLAIICQNEEILIRVKNDIQKWSDNNKKAEVIISILKQKREHEQKLHKKMMMKFLKDLKKSRK